MTLDGKEVFEFRPHFASPPELGASRLASAVSLSPARRQGFFPGKKPLHVLDHEYILRGSDIAAFEAWFNARGGRWEDFVVPSWTSELGVSETNVTNSTSGTASLYIDWCGYAANYGPTAGYLGRYIFILWSDGTFFVAQVNAVASSTPGAEEVLTLATNLPKNVEVDDPPVIGFLYHVRFAVDELELEYSGPNNAQAAMSFVEVAISTPETDVT